MLCLLLLRRENGCANCGGPGGSVETFTSQQEVAVGTDKGELLQWLISSVYE